MQYITETKYFRWTVLFCLQYTSQRHVATNIQLTERTKNSLLSELKETISIFCGQNTEILKYIF